VSAIDTCTLIILSKKETAEALPVDGRVVRAKQLTPTALEWLQTVADLPSLAAQ
jgi:hypothetical protein